MNFKWFHTISLLLLWLTLAFTVPLELSFAQNDFYSFFKATYDYRSVLIQKVVSADTFILENDKRIKLIGLQAPEPPKRKDVKRDTHGIIIEESNPESSIEERAFQFAKGYLEGKKIRLEFDIESKNEGSKTLAYAFLPDGSFVNQEILRQGYADLKIIPPNLKHADILRQAYREARAEKRGIHAE